ncbi:MAG: Ig-like domain-containing protein [Candidatus Thermoplasmatota archaeon]|nr:Ig-like domain-containing protein [Candidatus Thermoplasmatota archaeon]
MAIWERMSNGVSGRYLVVAVMVLLLASMFSALVPSAKAELNPPTMISPGYWETSGTWTIEAGDYVVHGNKTIYVNGNLIIEGQGTLVLFNVVLQINSTFPGEFFIEVQPGGTFLVYDGGDGLSPLDMGDSDASTIQGPGLVERYRFYIRQGGTFLLNRSRVVHCGLPPVGNPTYGDDFGIYSESDLTVIEDSILDMNSIGLIANHSRAIVRRTWIYNGEYGVVGAENALLEFTDVEIVWAASQGVFLNGSRMYLNDSFIARNGWGPGVDGLYAYRGSTLLMDYCAIMQNAGNGAFASDSTMVVTNSWIYQNGGAGLAWGSPPGVDIIAVAADNWIEDHSVALRVSPALASADSHIEFRRNDITIYNRGAFVTGLNITGNFAGNTLWNGVSGIVVDGETVDMDISRNDFDDHSGDAVYILSSVSATVNMELNTINNTYGSGSHGMYVESQQFADVRVANNTITNVSGPGVAVYSGLDAYIIAWSHNNTITNSSTDCGPNTCGAMYFYSFGGDVEVYAYENSIDICNDVGILALSDVGSVLADIQYNRLIDTGLMPMFFPASILVLANTGTAQFDILNNTVQTTPDFGIVSAAWAGIRGSVSGNSFLNIGFWSIYAVAGDGAVDIDSSNNTGGNIWGGIYSDSMGGDATVTLRNNVFSNYVDGIWLEFPSGNLTLTAHFNNVRFGDYNSLYVNIGGWLDAILDNNRFEQSNFDSSVYIVTGGQANLTMLNNRMGNAAHDGFHLEAPSANLVTEWNSFIQSRVNFNLTATDPYGHLMIDSYFDFSVDSVGSYSARVYAEGTSDMLWDYMYSLRNDREILFELNRSADVTIRRGWINGNDATGWMIFHYNGQLTLDVIDSAFRKNQAGLYVSSNNDAVIDISISEFNVNTMNYGLGVFAMSNLTLVTSSNEFSNNAGYGINAFGFGNLNYTGRSDTFALNGWDGLYLGAFGVSDVDIDGSDFFANCQNGGWCSGTMLDFSASPAANVTLRDITAVGNGEFGIVMFGVNARISDALIQGHQAGIYSISSDAIVESSQIVMNNQSLNLPSGAHFVVYNSSLDSASQVDFVLDGNSTLWGINTTFNINNGMFLDALSWAKRSWYIDIEVMTNGASPLAGAFVDTSDTFGTPYINGTTGADGFLRLNFVDDQWRNAMTAVHYNPYDITANAPGVGTALRTYSFYAYVHLQLVIWDVDGPIADAGPDQIVDEDTVVLLDGTNSTDNVEIQSYTWTFIDQGVPQSLPGPTPTYVFTEPGVYTITLEVDDWANPPATDTVQITVLDVTPPTADAGPDRNVPSGTLVQFDGSGSTDNVGVVNYTWTFTYNATLITLYGVNPTFTFVTPGDYTAILNVRDNASNGGADNMVVTVFDADPPIADAGPDQIVNEDTVVTFNGSGSTDNVGVVDYRWTFIEGANVVALIGVSPTYVFTEPGGYIVTLTVWDGAGWAGIDTMTVTVLDATPPTVIFTSPYDGATDQPLSTSVVIGFSEPMDTASVEAEITISSGAVITAYNWNLQDDIVTLSLSNLAYSSMYVINVNATATDASGIPMTSAYFFNFMTTASAGPDIISPEVIYSYPEDWATGVPIDVILKVVFSEPMNTIMTESAITISGAAIQSYSWFSNNTLVEIITTAPFSYSTPYTLSVSVTAQDAAGNPLSAAYSAAFTTEDPPVVDIIPPEIIFTDPEEGALGVPITASVYIVFSEPMSTDSVEAAVSISPVVGATNYYWTYNDTVLEVEFVGLLEGTLYTVTVTTVAEDVEGNPMSADFTLHFTTFAPGADITRPVIRFTSPDDGETDINVNANLVIVFSESMNTASVEAAIIISGVTPTGFSWSGDTTVTVILPVLAYSTSYLVNITDTAADLAGNTIFEHYLVLFHTEAEPAVDTTPPEVILTYPDDGDNDIPMVDGTITIVVVFSEPMDEASVETATDISAGTIHDFYWNADSSAVTIELRDAIYDTDYTLTIGSGAEDLAGNSLSQEVVDFTTVVEPEGPPAPSAEFDIAQAWWLILIIIILIVIVVLLLLMKRKPPAPVEEPAVLEEDVPMEEEIPELEEIIPEEPVEPDEPPAPAEPPSEGEVPVY